MSVKKRKVTKIEAKLNNVTAIITKGVKRVYTMDKDKNPLEEPVTVYKQLPADVTEYFVDDDGHEYYETKSNKNIKKEDGSVIKSDVTITVPCYDVLIISRPKKDKPEEVINKVYALPTYLVGATQKTLADLLEFKFR